METILLVEDDTDIHNLIKKILEKEKYKVINAYSGTEALMILDKENIELILLDLMLPGLNGEEIIKKVKEIPIIVISAKISEEDKINALLSGANDYIVKPFNTNELLARVKVQLRINKGKKVNTKMKYKDMFLNEENHILYIKEKHSIEKIDLSKLESINKSIGADEGTRTPTPLALVPKTSASTSSATSAYIN